MTRRRKSSSMGTTRVTADGTVAARGSGSETGESATGGSYSETGRTATKTNGSDSEAGRTATNGGRDGAQPAGIDAVFRVADVSDRFSRVMKTQPRRARRSLKIED